MSRETTNLGRLGGLQTFRDSLNNNSSSLPHLDGSRVRYEELVIRATELVSRQGALTAEKQEASKQLTETLTEAERLGTVLRLAVSGQHFGIRAEKLVEFNVKPFRGRKKDRSLDHRSCQDCRVALHEGRALCTPPGFSAFSSPPQASVAHHKLRTGSTSFCGASEASRRRKLLWPARSF